MHLLKLLLSVLLAPPQDISTVWVQAVGELYLGKMGRSESSWSSMDLAPGTISVFCSDTGFAQSGRTPLALLSLGPSATLSLLSHKIKPWISKLLCAEEEEALWVSYPKYLIVCIWEGVLWEEWGEFETYRVAGTIRLSNFVGKF